eukprot:845469-Prorocentrum_lima.AAC.1
MPPYHQARGQDGRGGSSVRGREEEREGGGAHHEGAEAPTREGREEGRASGSARASVGARGGGMPPATRERPSGTWGGAGSRRR